MIFVVGGGGKLKNADAVLVVTVPTGSTVTATKGGTTLTPTMWVKAADNTLDCAIFSIPASQFDSTTPWTVTATLGMETASATVLITENKEYEVTVSYWQGELFDNGNQFVSVTGGWWGNPNVSQWGRSNTGTVTVQNTIYISGDAAIASTKNKIPLADFSTLKVLKVSSTDNTTYVWIHERDSGSLSDSGGNVAHGNIPAGNNVTFSLDISSLSGDYYITIGVNGARTATISKVWLE